MPDTIYTTADLAALFSVSPRRIRAIVKQRRAKGLDVGRKAGQTWVFAPEEVELLRPGPAGWPRRKKDDG